MAASDKYWVTWFDKDTYKDKWDILFSFIGSEEFWLTLAGPVEVDGGHKHASALKRFGFIELLEKPFLKQLQISTLIDMNLKRIHYKKKLLREKLVISLHWPQPINTETKWRTGESKSII